MENEHYFPQPPPEERWHQAGHEQQQEGIFEPDPFTPPQAAATAVAPHRIAGETRAEAGTILPEGTLAPPPLQPLPVDRDHPRNPYVETGIELGCETARGLFESILALAA